VCRIGRCAHDGMDSPASPRLALIGDRFVTSGGEMAIKVIGLDIAKSVLQVHGVDEAGGSCLTAEAAAM
jgi:hypothetical protein